MAKRTNLTVHKNRLERQHQRQMRDSMVASAKNMGSQDVRAYAIVAIKADGRAMCAWDTGSILPMWAFSPTVEKVLRDDIMESGVEETWLPNLNERGRPR